MNKVLERFARETIKEGLSQLPEGNQMIFKRMYIPWAFGIINENRGLTDEELAIPIYEVVEKMPADKLDWAMTQVSNSIEKQKRLDQ